MSDAAECHIIDGGEDDEVSAHSAISGASDFEEDEQVDYLALELVHHLPAEKATKLLKNMRAKEKAVQDLLHRNRMLLDSCKRLDEENQSLSERLKEIEVTELQTITTPVKEAAEFPDAIKPVKEAAEFPAAIKPVKEAPEVRPAEVDSSVFLKLERGKEEQILLLKKDNEQLRREVNRLSEGGQGLEEALVQARKDLKKMQQGKKVVSVELQEEERLYKELQGRAAKDLVVARMQQRHAENRAKVQGVLQALVSDDLQRIKRWSSDVAAVLLAVEGLEGLLKPRKRSKAEDSQVLCELDEARSALDEADRAHSLLEETTRELTGRVDSAAAELDVGLAAAEREVDWLREENAAVVERVQAMSFEPMVTALGRTEQVLASLLSNAPPGLLPANVKEAHICVADASDQLAQRAQSLAALTEQSVGLGRRVRTLQAAQRTVRSEMQHSLTRELGASAHALESPLQTLRTRLRHGSEALGRARGGAERPAAPTTAQGEFREVHAMGRALIANLEEGGRALEERMEQVFVALSGDQRPEEPRPEEPRNTTAEGKKKRSKKKSRAEPEQRQEPTDEESQVRAAEVREAFGDSETATGGRVLTGPELLHELQALRSDAEALEARMAERLRAREQPAEVEASVARPKMQRRRKMYV